MSNHTEGVVGIPGGSSSSRAHWISTSEITEARLFDTTLRDGEQSPRTSFSYEDKREIAAILDEMGTHVIEAGFPVNSDAEFEAVRDIADALAPSPSVGWPAWLTRTSRRHSTRRRPGAHVRLHQRRPKPKTPCTRRARKRSRARWSPSSASRTPVSSPCSPRWTPRGPIASSSSTSSRPSPRPTSTGSTSPTPAGGHAATLLRPHRGGRQSHRRPGRRPHARRLHLAAANAISGYEAGAAQAQVSVNGIGERAGNAAYEEVVMTLESLYDVDTGIDTTRITELSNVIEEKSGIDTPANKPIVGTNAFSHESGIHAAGVIENLIPSEPGVMTPEMVGARRQLVLGKHTGQHSVRGTARRGGLRPDRRPGPGGHPTRQRLWRREKARHRRGTDALRRRRRRRGDRRGGQALDDLRRGFDRRSATGIGGSGGETDSIPGAPQGDRPPAPRHGLSQKPYYGCGTEIRTDDGARCTKGSPRRQRRTRSPRGYCRGALAPHTHTLRDDVPAFHEHRRILQ